MGNTTKGKLVVEDKLIMEDSLTTGNKLITLGRLYCEENGLRFTDPRRDVLAKIATSNKPIGAYDILGALAQELSTRASTHSALPAHPKPPTVYRAIQFWSEHGFIHRIESLNAYIACHAGHKHQGSQFMICEHCHRVIELAAKTFLPVLETQQTVQVFEINRYSIEIYGVCKACQ